MFFSQILMLFSVAASGVLAAPPAPPAALAPANAKAVEFNWTRFGHALKAGMPKELQDASPLRQAQYLAEQTAEKLAALGIPPNYDQAGRKRAQGKFNDHTLGTCGHSALCVKQVWTGAGFPEKSCKTLIVMKRLPDGQLKNEINADHAAMVYLHPDGPIVCDLWCDGRAQKTFANFRASVWKGMPAGEWARRMAQEGYTHSGCQEHPELGETPPLELPALLRKLQADPPAKSHKPEREKTKSRAHSGAK